MRRTSRIRPALAALGLLLATAAAAEGPGVKFKAGDRAAAFRCPLLGGDEFSLSDQIAQGQAVVLSFFDTNCKPCMTEIPRLAAVMAGYAGKPVAAYLVSVGGEDEDTVKKFVAAKGFTLPVIYDHYGLRVGERYGVVQDEIARVPQVVLITKNGVVKAMWAGFHEGMEAKLTALLDEMVAEPKAAAAAADEVTILYTNNTNGMILQSPMIEVGGLARRGTVLKAQRKEHPGSLVLDGGDLLPTSPDEARSRQVLAAYAAMKYDAVGLGEAEFVNGLSFLRGRMKARTVPFLCANAKICQADQCVDFARSYLMATCGRRKVAVFGYMSPDAVGFTPPERFKDGSWYVKFVDPLPLLKGFLATARAENADLVVVISHAGVEADHALAAAVPGIDLIVGAHSQTMLPDPAREGDTLIVQAASDGQYVGRVTFKWGDAKKPQLASAELIPLTKNLAEDPEVKAALDAARVAAAD